MGLIERASQMPALRRLFLPLLKRLSFDVSINHPWVPGLRIRLNSFRHKGYWFFGKGLEQSSMELFARFVPVGGTVVEVGGHIRYITGHFAAAAGANGKIIVFEPVSNYLPYIRTNVEAIARNSHLASVTLLEKAVGPEAGNAEFFEDSLAGQNNSIVKDLKGLSDNAENTFVSAEVIKRTMGVVALDDFLGERSVDFVNIDVEGFEFGVLQGMCNVVDRKKPILMVEAQASEDDIFQYFTARNYLMFDEEGKPLSTPDQLSGNVFVLNAQKHLSQTESLF